MYKLTTKWMFLKNQFLHLIMTYMHLYLAELYGFNHQPNKILIFSISALEAVSVSYMTRSLRPESKGVFT